MKIVIDGREANVLNRVGSNVYAFEIIRHIYELSGNKHQVTILLDKDPIKDLPKSRSDWQYQTVLPSRFWTQWALPLHLFSNKKKYDVFFTPSHYGPRLSPIPTVTTIFDLAYLRYPEQFTALDRLQLKAWTGYSAKQAESIITISDFSKDEIMKLYKRGSSDITVAPPAVTVPENLSNLSKQTITKNPYLLYVGTLQPRKNLVRLVAAFEQVKRKIEANSLGSTRQQKKLQNLQLIIAGKVGWLASDIQERIKQSPFKNDIIQTGFIDEETKWQLLLDAKALVQVGLYEGFGIPVLEAFYANCPVVASQVSSLPEAGGKAALYVNPEQTKSIADGLTKALTLTTRQKAQLRKKAREHREQFSWSDSAAAILKTIAKTQS